MCGTDTVGDDEFGDIKRPDGTWDQKTVSPSVVCVEMGDRQETVILVLLFSWDSLSTMLSTLDFSCLDRLSSPSYRSWITHFLKILDIFTSV